MPCITLPGLIDIRVHIRHLDSEHKEDIECESAAALAGGITMILIIANVPQIVDQKNFNLLKEYAAKQSLCDYALYLGASEKNYDITCEYITEAAGLEMNLCNPIDDMKLSDVSVWIKHLLNWPNRSLGPIICHAHQKILATAILLAHLTDRRIHICYVRNKDDIYLIRSAKIRGIKITCDICIHDLFLSSNYNIPHYITELISSEDQKALWDNLEFIDVFTTAHFSYTPAEKKCNNYLGYPALETALPLLLNAVAQGRLTIEDIIKKMNTNPKKIFDLPDQPDTYITVDLNKELIIPKQNTYSKVKWIPYSGKRVIGKLCKVVLRGQVVYNNEKILALPGYGRNVRCEWYNIPKCRCQDYML